MPTPLPPSPPRAPQGAPDQQLVGGGVVLNRRVSPPVPPLCMVGPSRDPTPLGHQEPQGPRQASDPQVTQQPPARRPQSAASVGRAAATAQDAQLREVLNLKPEVLQVMMHLNDLPGEKLQALKDVQPEQLDTLQALTLNPEILQALKQLEAMDEQRLEEMRRGPVAPAEALEEFHQLRVMNEQLIRQVFACEGMVVLRAEVQRSPSHPQPFESMRLSGSF